MVKTVAVVVIIVVGVGVGVICNPYNKSCDGMGIDIDRYMD